MNKVTILLVASLLITLLGACNFPIVAPKADPTSVSLPLSTVSAFSSPESGATVSGDVEIVGSAMTESFQQYQLFYKPEPNGDDAYIYFGGNTAPVDHGILGIWSTQGLTPGQYSLRLRVVKNNGNYAEFYLLNLMVE